jgi:acyl carrier protein
MTADARNDLPARVLDLVAAALFLERERASQLTLETSFLDDLDMDSLTQVRIEMLIETRLGLELPADEAAEIVTIGDLVTAIRTKARPVQTP